MTSFYYYDQNPLGFCFLMQIGTFVIQTSLGLPNLNMKEKTKRILVVVAKWRHRASGLLQEYAKHIARWMLSTFWEVSSRIKHLSPFSSPTSVRTQKEGFSSQSTIVFIFFLIFKTAAEPNSVTTLKIKPLPHNLCKLLYRISKCFWNGCRFGYPLGVKSKKTMSCIEETELTNIAGVSIFRAASFRNV